MSVRASPFSISVSRFLLLTALTAFVSPQLASAAPPCFTTTVDFLSRQNSPAAQAFARTLTEPVILVGPPESHAIRRMGILLEATGVPTAKVDASGLILHLTPGKGGTRTLGNVKYIEFPNSTLLDTVDPKTGKTRSWLFARGVRQYSTDVNLKTGTISPQKNVSDVLMYEIKEGKAEYRSRLLTSNAEAKFFFEDPRISVLHAADGKARVLLSGTDYSPHVAGAVDPDVMNRYLTLELDHRGVPRKPKVNALGIPKFSNLSPFPKLLGDRILSIDAKNATFATNELGQIVVRTRLRPDFKFPEIKAMAGDDTWKYAEQVFVFNDFDELTRYDWDNCLNDLFQKEPAKPEGRVKPLLATTLIRDSQIRELFQDPRVVKAKGKGLGPGTPPVRVVRRGNQLFASAGKNAKELFAGELPADFYLKDGDAKYLTFDHEIRYFMDSREGQDFLKRHYTLSVKQFDKTLTQIEAYYGDAMQPKLPHELGHHSGIADLQHVYPMGWRLVVGEDGVARVQLSLGVSDAHTELVEVELVTLLKEMAPGSERRASGQVYGIDPVRK